MCPPTHNKGAVDEDGAECLMRGGQQSLLGWQRCAKERWNELSKRIWEQKSLCCPDGKGGGISQFNLEVWEGEGGGL